ncbi:MAG TPA: multidrug efflux RND transporter permease subunit [Povalibacter sp.]|uniref:efflux RND transporter permease subunit n=1 Tax=Povalibacter sp. TaxID=1962978 RepID=UPI002B734F76|nr:multidrug efflux RND transporter permease subunit [Povalibacter sp.]HMN44001.1 multidrug efflux RND transporter permease subunit [Povalibacter sp.]
MARFFIDRPVFAIVISLFLLLVGTLSLFSLPVGEFPEIALPTVQVRAAYVGASSDVVEASVTAPLDRQINGVTDMLYINGVSGDDGSASLTVTFALERDPDIAAVEVQNRVSQATATLPSEVNNAGVTVRKQSPDTLMFLALHATDDTLDSLFVNNYAYVYIVDPLKRVKGIGDVQVFGSEYGMRIWLRPDRLASLRLTASDVARAIQEQNVQAPAGQVGQPPADANQSFQYSLRVRGRLVDPEEFADIIVGSRPDGSFIRVRDVGRVELGGRDYNYRTRYEGMPAAMMAISLAPGANAMETAKLIKEQLATLKLAFPAGLDYRIMYDSSDFVTASINEVVHTFIEALILVLIVVYLFLQSWRATLIPMLAVPVSLVATFAAYQLLGFSINTLSLFGLVLAIGIVVDDAIVVVEAVEQNMHAHKLSPRDATRKAMDEVQGPVIAIALVLSAVFVPMAFIPGVTGLLYKQFALTVAVSTLFSAVVALTLTPALCAMLLKPQPEHAGDAPPRGPLRRFFHGFNHRFDRLNHGYGRAARLGARRVSIAVTLLVVVVLGVAGMLQITPTGFVPDEDKGAVFMQVILPDAAAQQRTLRVLSDIEAIARAQPGVDAVAAVAGLDMISGTAASNCALVIVKLKPWDERTAKNVSAPAILGALSQKTQHIPEAFVFAFNPPALPGFGAVSGFSAMLEARGNQTAQELAQTAQQLIGALSQDPAIGRITTTFSANTPNYQLAVDREKVKKLGVPVSDVFTTFQTFMGGYQVNEFTAFGRNYKVTIQADTEFRREVRDIAQLFVRNAQGDMVPLDAVTSYTPSTGSRFLQRYNLYRTAALSGAPATGASSGQAMAAVERIAAATLPADYAIEWTGQSLQEKLAGNTATLVMGLSLVVVFLFLAALYESWTVPFAVLMATPFGFLGALLALKLTGVAFNVYGQIGLVTLIGLSAKNAILIVEFAKLNREAGKPLIESALEAARLRLRPILMTSFAFILGVVPLVLASGAGASSKHSVGIAVFGGMILATLLTTLAVPAFYVLIQGLSEKLGGGPPQPAPAPEGAA